MAGINAYTKFLLRADGADTSTAFADVSSQNHAITALDGAQIKTDQKVFGNGSAFFNGAGATTTEDMLQTASHANFALGDGNPFCIDFRARIHTKVDSNGLRGLFRAQTGGYGLIWRFDTDSKLHLYLSSDTSFTNIANSQAGTKSDYAIDTWYHIALTWDGTTYRVFVDGVLDISVVSSTSLYNTAQAMFIGAWDAGDYGLHGWIDEFRVQRGEAVWTDTFTPPTAQYSTSDAISATGGTITYSGGRTIHTFTSNGNFVVSGAGGLVDILLVAGGGGGGGGSGNNDAGAAGGGGGAGGVKYSAKSLSADTYAIVIGGGGAGNKTDRTVGGSGGNSTGLGFTATGGGGGGYTGNTGVPGSNGVAGGCGGGAGGTYDGSTISGGAGSQGGRGGNNPGGAGRDGGGGGGGGAVGANSAGNSTGFAGGAGIYNSISGSSVAYSGGGGGGNWDGANAGAGGAGGGGAGGTATVAGVAGTANTGGGGGGGGADSGVTAGTASGAGGTGVVIISYVTPASGYFNLPMLGVG